MKKYSRQEIFWIRIAHNVADQLNLGNLCHVDVANGAALVKGRRGSARRICFRVGRQGDTQDVAIVVYVHDSFEHACYQDVHVEGECGPTRRVPSEWFKMELRFNQATNEFEEPCDPVAKFSDVDPRSPVRRTEGERGIQRLVPGWTFDFFR